MSGRAEAQRREEESVKRGSHELRNSWGPAKLEEAGGGPPGEARADPGTSGHSTSCCCLNFSLSLSSTAHPSLSRVGLYPCAWSGPCAKQESGQ